VRTYTAPGIVADGPSRTAVEFSVMDQIELRGENVGFSAGSTTLAGSARPLLVDVATFMHEDPTMVVQVEGHTCASPMWGMSNTELSQGRADSVVAALIELGVGATRLRGVGFGEQRPLLDNTTRENKTLNRRVEFLVVPTPHGG
jgi:outer membrane protein OmpA-like peptidoglycan-associated protein